MNKSRGAQGAGKRNRRIVILKEVKTRAAGGQVVVTWEPAFKPLNAWVIGLSGLEAIRAGAEVAISRASVRIPYRPKVVETMRVQIGPVQYKISGIAHDLTRRRHTDLACEAVTGGI